MYRLKLPPVLIEEGTVRYELNPLCTEVAQGMANLFSLTIRYKLAGESGNSETLPVTITFRDNGFDVQYSDTEAMFEIALYYNDSEVERFRHTPTVTGIVTCLTVLVIISSCHCLTVSTNVYNICVTVILTAVADIFCLKSYLCETILDS